MSSPNTELAQDPRLSLDKEIAQRYIQHGHIYRMLAEKSLHGIAIGTLGHNLQVLKFLEGIPHTFQKHRVIIGQQQFYRLLHEV